MSTVKTNDILDFDGDIESLIEKTYALREKYVTEVERLGNVICALEDMKSGSQPLGSYVAIAAPQGEKTEEKSQESDGKAEASPDAPGGQQEPRNHIFGGERKEAAE